MYQLPVKYLHTLLFRFVTQRHFYLFIFKFLNTFCIRPRDKMIIVVSNELFNFMYTYFVFFTQRKIYKNYIKIAKLIDE